MQFTIEQIRKTTLENGNILGIHNLTGTILELKQIKLIRGFAYEVVTAYHKQPSSSNYESLESLIGVLFWSEDVTLFDKFMRPYTQTKEGRIMHTIDPKTLIDGGFHGYSRNN